MSNRHIHVIHRTWLTMLEYPKIKMLGNLVYTNDALKFRFYNLLQWAIIEYMELNSQYNRNVFLKLNFINFISICSGSNLLKALPCQSSRMHNEQLRPI